MSRAVDFALGAAALALAGGYAAMAREIPVSLLSDAVGPGGVPLVVAGILAVGGGGLILRTALVGAGEAKEDGPDHLRALGLLALLVAYVAAVPLLGYPLSLALLAGMVAWFAGARGWPVAAFALGLAALFWIAFVLVLGIPFPAGLLFGG